MLTINIPTLYAGQKAIITWDKPDTAGTVTYKLERRFDKDFSAPATMTWENFAGMWGGKSWQSFNTRWQGSSWADFNTQQVDFTIYTGQATGYTDSIIETGAYAVYRLSVSVDGGEFEVAGETDKREIIPNRPPIITGQDSDLGTKYKGFSVEYMISDPDPNNEVTTYFYFDDALWWYTPNTQQNVNNTATIADGVIFGLPDQSRHTIRIVAVDQKGAKAERKYTFTVAEDLFKTATMYLLIKNETTGRFYPIAKVEKDEYYDYFNVGTHTYKVRVVDRYDNFADSNEVTVTIEVKAGQLALVDKLTDMFPLRLNRGGAPVRNDSQEYSFIEKWYEGRSKPVHIFTGQKPQTLSLEFTHRTLGEKERLLRLIETGGLFVYRDLYSKHMVGHITRNANTPSGINGDKAIIEYSLSMTETDYREGIDYD